MGMGKTFDVMKLKIKGFHPNSNMLSKSGSVFFDRDDDGDPSHGDDWVELVPDLNNELRGRQAYNIVYVKGAETIAIENFETSDYENDEEKWLTNAGKWISDVAERLILKAAY